MTEDSVQNVTEDSVQIKKLHYNYINL
uniref:Uncharacterized protein n=1 Tax=Anguilla anguilla TaxID=7936 RepID=A0A0E9XQX8_ANGAN